MKKVLVLSIFLLLLVILAACGDSNSNSSSEVISDEVVEEGAVQIPKTAEEMLTALMEKNENVTDILVWNEENDPNSLLGRPGNYIGKADFSDTRVEEIATNDEEKLLFGLEGGTIEVFKSKSDCDKRYEYLKQLSEAGLGAIGPNQYMYKYDLVLFRVSYKVPPTGADEYKKQMDEILNEESITADN